MKTVLRPLPDNATGTPRLTVCVNDRGENAIAPSCGPRGGAALEAAIRDAVGASGFDCEVQTIRCLGLCEKGPNVRLAPGNNWFHDVTPEDAAELAAAAAAHMAERG